MNAGIEVAEAVLHEKAIVRYLIELYRHDFSEFDDTDVDDFGLYGYRYLDHYWTEDGRYPFLVRVDGRIAGFALVRRRDGLVTAGPVSSVAEFFILRKYRRRGVGERVARWLFERFPGSWEVQQTAENAPAQTFWRNVIERYTADQYREVVLDDERWRGTVQALTSHG
jgi:predicted acetyltransferase